jgi:hypothetical protein
MSVTTKIYDKSDTDMIKYSALIIVLAQAVGFGLGFIGTSEYIGLVGDAIYAVGLFLLGSALYRIGISFPSARPEAESTRKWLFIYGGSIIFMYIPIVGLAGALVALVTGIGSFLKLNGLFKKVSQSAPQQGKLDSWVFPLFAFYGLIAGVVIFVAAFITVLTLGIALGFLIIMAYVIAGGGVLLVLGVAYVLYENSKKLELIRQTTDFSQLAPVIAPGVYAPISAPATYAPVQPVQPVQPVSNVQEKFCSNCGSKNLASDKFCPNCGATIE